MKEREKELRGGRQSTPEPGDQHPAGGVVGCPRRLLHQVSGRGIRGRDPGRYRTSQNVTALEYLHSQQRRIQLMRQMAEFMEDLDMYVSPSSDSNLTNHTGHPAAVFPYRFQNGQPQCIVVIGDLFADDKLMSVAHAYQSATEWHLRHPEIS